MAGRFPDGLTLKKMENTNMRINSQDFQLTRIISERRVFELNERMAVFEGQRLQDGEDIGLKLRIQMDPELIEPSEDRDGIVKWAVNSFKKECRAIEECESTVHIPKFYRSEELQQDRLFEFPGGYLNVFAMSKVPGFVATDIQDLADRERSLIKMQLTAILENMRLRGWRYLRGAPDQIIYDRTTGKTYLTGLTRVISKDPEKTTPITESSGTIWEFGLNIWRW